MADRLVPVSVAHNDDNGQPSGRATALEIDLLGSDPIRLLATDMRGPVCRLLAAGRSGTLQLGRHRYPFVGLVPWCGSIVWDAVRLEHGDAKRLLVNARRSSWWSIDDAPSRYRIWWLRAAGHSEAIGV